MTPRRETPYLLKVSNRRWWCASLEEASARYVTFRNARNRGASDTPVGYLYVDVPRHPHNPRGNGRLYGHVSYNGRVWLGLPADWASGVQPIYDPPRAPAPTPTPITIGADEYPDTIAAEAGLAASLTNELDNWLMEPIVDAKGVPYVITVSVTLTPSLSE